MMGLPVLVELGIVIVATQLTRKHVLENAALHALVARRLQASRNGASVAVERMMTTLRLRRGGTALVACASGDVAAVLCSGVAVETCK